MEKRTLLAVGLSAVVFILYYTLIYKPPIPQTSVGVGSHQPLATPQPSLSGSLPETPAPRPNAIRGAKRLDVLENSLLKAELNNESALPVHWWLKKYFVQPDNKGPNIDLLTSSSEVYPVGLLLFPEGPPLYPDLSVIDQKQSEQITYHGEIKNGDTDLLITQTLTLGKKDYTLEVNLSINNQGSQSVHLTPGIHIETQQNSMATKGFWVFREAPNLRTPLYRIGPKISRHTDWKKMTSYAEENGEISWVGIQDRYFLRAVLANEVFPQNKVSYGKKGDDSVFVDFRYAPQSLPSGQKKDYSFTLYLGPKDPSSLKGFGAAELDKAIDWGWFGWAAIPILQLLKWFQTVLHNWGLAIITLTLLIKLATQPLTKKSMESMKAMQQLQPQLQKIREKYGNDRERLNVETMNLFRQHKVNPMGGCLPMVIQMPIYIALYKVLYNATELYHAPFFGPYQDLSASDPYFIMPILLGIMMVAQQRMTPNVGDPSQAKMMMIMPLLFTVFMLFLPVGLVLYILVNTFMTVVQQYMHKRDLSLLKLIRRQNNR